MNWNQFKLKWIEMNWYGSSHCPLDCWNLKPNHYWNLRSRQNKIFWGEILLYYLYITLYIIIVSKMMLHYIRWKSSYFFQLSTNHNKKYFMRPNKIYIFRISSSRSIECRDLRKFLEFKKIEVIIFFFNFKEFFTN